MTDSAEPIKETKEEYFITRVGYCFGIRNKISYDKFKKSFETEENKNIMDMFFKDNDSIQ